MGVGCEVCGGSVRFVVNIQGKVLFWGGVLDIWFVGVGCEGLWGVLEMVCGCGV